MVIKVLGKGCKNCATLEEHVKAALKELGKEATVEKITDINTIADYGVMRTPALVIDEQLVVQGQVASIEDIKKLL